MAEAEGLRALNLCSTAEAENIEKEVMTMGKFVISRAKNGEYRFRLKARNGQNIGRSEGYKAKASCLNGIDSVGRNAPEATVVVEE